MACSEGCVGSGICSAAGRWYWSGFLKSAMQPARAPVA